MADRNETFVTVKDFPNYSISNKGKVLSYTNTEEGRLLKPQKDSQGYVHVRLYDGTDKRGIYKNGEMKPKLEKVHRLVALHFLTHPDTNTYYEVNHIDGNKINNDVTNLEWLTRRENVVHAWNTGLNTEGALRGGNKRSKPVKLTNEDGSIEYYFSQTECAVSRGCSPILIMNRIKRGNASGYGRLGFTVERIDRIPVEEIHNRLEDIEDKLKEYRNKYFGSRRKTKYIGK